MTTAKAATVASALITAGYACSARMRGPDDWVIRSQAEDFDVPASVVAAFVANQGIVGQLAEVEYS